MAKSAYAKSGVDITMADKFTGIIGGLVKSTLNSKVYKSIGGYASLYKIDEQRFIAASTDGVGTKLKLAFALNKHDTVGIDLVAMSVNDLICTGAQPLFFLDYFATGKLDLATSTKVLRGIVGGCKQGGLALVGGETAEMPSMYAQGEYDLAGFAVGLVERSNLLDGSRVRPGDALIGMESSGIHSNGFSLVRKLFKPREKDWLKRALLPTKIYVEAVEGLHYAIGKSLHGLAHITGSGFLNVPRLNLSYDYRIVIPEKFKRALVLDECVKRAGLSMQEAYTTFNMGFGMVAAVKPSAAKTAVVALAKQGVRAHFIGEVGPKKTGRDSKVHIIDETSSITLK